MPRVAVVTDSTADIPRDLAEARGLRVVPMTVSFGDREFISGVTLGAADFYRMLATTDELPRTSQPNPAWFEEAYADAADDGLDEVVSLHISSQLSGTCDLARTVGAKADLPVTVVDTRLAGGALALSVLAALRAAEAGADAAEVAAAGERVAEDVRLYFVVDDLEYLRRGGRLSGAQKWLGTMLKVKPILTLDDGRVQPLEKVRTFSKAIERLGELAAQHAAGEPVDVVVMHGCDPERGAAMWEAVRASLDVRDSLESVIGPVVGTHLGPGAVGVALTRRRG